MAWAAATMLADDDAARTDLWLRLNPVSIDTGTSTIVRGSRGPTLRHLQRGTPTSSPDLLTYPLGAPMSTTLITGASAGSGPRWPASSPRGHDLALCARRTDRLDELAAEIARSPPGRRVAVKALDVNDHDAVFRVFESSTTSSAASTGSSSTPASARARRSARSLRRQQGDRRDQLHRCAGPDRGGRRDLPRPGAGHLVMVSSFSALRGMPKNVTTYAATKAAVAHLAEGFRADVHGTPIKVTVLFPGYIVSEMSEDVREDAADASTEKGVRAMVEAIEKEKKSAVVPAWPWVPLGFVVNGAGRAAAPDNAGPTYPPSGVDARARSSKAGTRAQRASVGP